MKKTPKIGLGTWRLWGDECISIVRSALNLGYSHIDTAFNYENHSSIAKAIEGIPRDQFFITSTVMLNQGDVETICETSLKELGLDFLDMYLIHWPDRSQPMDLVIEKMERLKKQGKIRAYGVSNFTISHLQDMICLKAKLASNQVEFHPYLYQKKLWDFCTEHNIDLVAYRPLGKGALLKDPIACQIASSYSKTPAQILLRWLYQKHIPFVVKASSEKHLQSNLLIEDFSLQDSDVLALDSLHCNQRFCNQSWSDFEY